MALNVKKSLGGLFVGVGLSAAASPTLEFLGIPQNEYSLAQRLVEGTILKNDPTLVREKELLVELTYGYLTTQHAAECQRFIASACYIRPDRALEVAFRLAITQDIVKNLDASGFNDAIPLADTPKAPGFDI